MASTNSIAENRQAKSDLAFHLLTLFPILLWGVGCWAFFQFCYPYHFFYKEQNQLFLLTTDTIWQYIEDGPGWMARLIGDFLTQFYYYLYAGAVILTGCLLVLGDFLRRALANLMPRRSKWPYWIAIILITLEAWRHLWYGYHLSSTISIIGYAGVLWLCTILIRKNKKIGFIILALAVLPCWFLFGKPQKGKFTTPQWQLERFFALDNEYYWGNYNKVIQLAKETKDKDELTVFFFNLANAQKGELADHLLEMQPVSLGTEWRIGPETPLLNIKVMNELYYALGDMTYAERAAMQGMVFTETNRNVRMLERLRDINMLAHNEVAEKYTHILSQTLVHNKAPKLPQRYMNTQDTLRLGDKAVTILSELVESNAQNTMALDYLLCHELAQYNVEAFKNHYDRYCLERGNPRPKKIYQEALCIWLSAKQADNEMAHRYLTDGNIVQRFQKYLKVRGDKAQSQAFKDTYWYYFDNTRKEK